MSILTFHCENLFSVDGDFSNRATPDNNKKSQNATRHTVVIRDTIQRIQENGKRIADGLNSRCCDKPVLDFQKKIIILLIIKFS